MDVATGHSTVIDRRREFVAFLRQLDASRPPATRLRPFWTSVRATAYIMFSGGPPVRVRVQAEARLSGVGMQQGCLRPASRDPGGLEARAAVSSISGRSLSGARASGRNRLAMRRARPASTLRRKARLPSESEGCPRAGRSRAGSGPRGAGPVQVRPSKERPEFAVAVEEACAPYPRTEGLRPRAKTPRAATPRLETAASAAIFPPDQQEMTT